MYSKSPVSRQKCYLSNSFKHVHVYVDLFRAVCDIFMFGIIGFSVGIDLQKYQRSLDLSQEATVTTFDNILHTQQDVFLEL